MQNYFNRIRHVFFYLSLLKLREKYLYDDYDLQNARVTKYRMKEFAEKHDLLYPIPKLFAFLKLVFCKSK